MSSKGRSSEDGSSKDRSSDERSDKTVPGAGSDRCLCDIYKGKEEEMYLFVDQRDGLDRVPQALLERFGETRLVTTLVLTPQRRLARAEADKVLEAIRDQGFYLQMPPPKHVQRDEAMADLSVRNEKLPR